MQTKICKQCGVEKNIEDFYKNKTTKDGYNGVCKECRINYKKEWTKKQGEDYWKNYYLENKEKIDDRNKKSVEKHKERFDKYQKEYRIINKERIRERNKKYAIRNKEVVQKRKNNWAKKKRENDAVYDLACAIRANIKNVFKRTGYHKEYKSDVILGMDFISFKKYIESKFEPWMSWENRGKFNGEFNYGWDLDHIIPISTAKNKEDILKLNHYSNFQPLCSMINRTIKKNNINYE
jgi:hypothetical protein